MSTEALRKFEEDMRREIEKIRSLCDAETAIHKAATAKADAEFNSGLTKIILARDPGNDHAFSVQGLTEAQLKANKGTPLTDMQQGAIQRVSQKYFELKAEHEAAYPIQKPRFSFWRKKP